MWNLRYHHTHTFMQAKSTLALMHAHTIFTNGLQSAGMKATYRNDTVTSSLLAVEGLFTVKDLHHHEM